MSAMFMDFMDESDPRRRHAQPRDWWAREFNPVPDAEREGEWERLADCWFPSARYAKLAVATANGPF